MKIRGFATLSLIVLFVMEIAVRATGMVSFPTYDVDPIIGYIPKPNQHGKFLQSHAWAFNDRSMGTDSPWNPLEHRNVLVIGNSIVMGGNVYDQEDKVGPLIQRTLGDAFAVWPIAAGGWTNVNETVYLQRNPDVAQSQSFFIWEVMSGGLSNINTWRSDYIWPRQQPLLASWYVFRRYVLARFIKLDTSELPPTGHVDPVALRNFEATIASLSSAAGLRHPGIILLYPTKAEYESAKAGQAWLPERTEIERIASSNDLILVDVSRDLNWNEALYRADGVHPNVEGNIELAHLLTSTMNKAFASEPSSRLAAEVSAGNGHL
jgi:lysophospholipase L1-like esterase